MRIALIGLGDIAQKAYLPVMSCMTDVVPVLCTRNANTLAEVGRKYRINHQFTQIEDLLKKDIDAAMVHTHTDSHAEIVEKLLNAGIPTFVDKPLSYTLSETEHLLMLAEKNNVTLFVGFNRRYAPLITEINEPNPIHISLNKNRAYLPSSPRTFIFDDFIHVIDSLRFLSSGSIERLQVAPHIVDDNKLAAIHVRWQAGNTLLTGNMNRICGHEEEVLEVFGQRQKWKINQLSQGCYHNEQGSQNLGFNDWETTLHKRGFTRMLGEFVEQVKKGGYDSAKVKDIFTTHKLCEQILSLVQRR